MTGSSVLEVAALGKAFAGRTLFRHVNLSVRAGEAIAITGDSGTGKTTFLRCLNGLERADHGTVTVGPARLLAGDDPARFRLAALALRRRVGFVFQGFHLFAHRSVLANVMEGPVYVRGEPGAAAEARARALLAEVGIEHRAAAWPHELSGGEQQRAAIARALAMNPDLLLLDEPTSALDRTRVEGLTTLLGRLVEGGLALVTVTHDERFARSIASRVLRLQDGTLSPG